MRDPNLQPLAAGAAALLLVASMAWWLLSAPEPVDPGQPTWKGEDIVRLKAAMPKIADLNHFYVNHDNPFVPHNLRVAERDIYNPNRPRGGQTPPPPPQQVVRVLPPRDPVKVVEPTKPLLVLPKLTRPPINAPIAYGLLVKDGQELVIVRMPDAKESMNLKPGDKIGGWTLISIDSGNLATFLDPQGIEHRFAIGQGDLAVAQSEGAALVPAKSTTDPAKGGRGMVPKAPVPGGPQTVPVARPPGVDGPIPRPPPREERRKRENSPDGQPPKDPQSVPVPKK